MKPGVGSDKIGLICQNTATLGKYFVEIIQCLKIFVGQRFIGQGPETLGRLNFWRIWRQEHQFDPVWHIEVIGYVPTRPVEHQNDVLVGACADLTGERREKSTEDQGIDGIANEPHHLSGCRTHEAIEVEPLEPVVAVGDRTAAPWCPYLPYNRLQSKPMLIKRPDFNRYRGFRSGELGNPGLKFFLKTSCS